MNVRTGCKYAFVFCLAVVINAAFLWLVPLLSYNNSGTVSSRSLNPISITLYKPPSVPEKNREKRVIRTAEMKPGKIPVVIPESPGRRKTKPRLDLQTSMFTFDINPGLELGMNVIPPAQPQTDSMPFSGEFGPGEVDQVPRLLHRVKPVYPYSARIRGITGRVLVKFLVDARGYVRNPTILKATPKGVFEQAVLDVVRKWKFKPGYRQGHPVATWVVLPIQFELTSGT